MSVLPASGQLSVGNIWSEITNASNGQYQSGFYLRALSRWAQDNTGQLPFSLATSGSEILQFNSYGNSRYSISKVGGVSNAWDEHAYSTSGSSAGSVVTLEFTANETNTYKMMGLTTDPLANASYYTIDFAWYPQANGTVEIYENGNKIGTNYGTYTTSTVFAITAYGGGINYYIDGSLKRSVGTVFQLPYFIDSSIYSLNGGFDNIKFYNGPYVGSNTFVEEDRISDFYNREFHSNIDYLYYQFEATPGLADAGSACGNPEFTSTWAISTRTPGIGSIVKYPDRNQVIKNVWIRFRSDQNRSWYVDGTGRISTSAVCK